MPLNFAGQSPKAVWFRQQAVNRILYNGREVWAALPEPDTLENMSWADISRVCRAGKAAEYWQLGDTKTLNNQYTLQIIGMDHDRTADASAYGRERAGLTLQTVQAGPSAAMNSAAEPNTSWYHASDTLHCAVRRVTLPDFYASLPDAVKSVIVPVQKEYIDAATQTRGIVNESLWIASKRELYGGSETGFGSEGSPYAFYAAGSAKTKYSGSSAVPWWTRSPSGSGAQFYSVSFMSSTSPVLLGVTNQAYVVPCFCV